MGLFTKGNSKLGREIHVFNLPTKQTCPGATASCLSSCYASKGRFNQTSVKNRTKQNLELSRRLDFDRLLSAEITTERIRFIRVHSSGDLYKPDYAAAWLRVMRMHPHVIFWFYTRSWRVAKIRPILAKMAKLENVHVWFSVDKDSGIPKSLPKRVRTAWMMTAVDDVPPRSVDLVFRVNALRNTVAKTVSGAPICPTETGESKAHDVTCSSCRKCFSPDTKTSSRISLTVLD